MKSKIVVVVITALLLLLTTGESVYASSKADCEVMTIHVSNEGQGIDTTLKKFETIFKKAPFSNFNTFKLTNSQIIEIDTDSPRELSLPDAIGGSLHLGRQKKGLLALTLTLTRKGRKTITIKGEASPGAPLFAAGMASATGVWVFGIACKSKDSLAPY